MWQKLVVLSFLWSSAMSVQAAPSTPTADFTINGDGTVMHKATGLTWKRCAEGMAWSGSTCSGSPKTYTWAEANALSADGWRLPRIDELVTVTEWDASNPAINATIFPNAPTSPGAPTFEFWSASVRVDDSYYAWGVNVFSGSDYNMAKEGSAIVRLVRGGRALDSSGLYTPTGDFSDNGDGSVTHSKTSLVWKRCAEGQVWTGANCSGTAKDYTWSEAKALGAGDWRLPMQHELQTIVEWGTYQPAINSTIFPNTPVADFWSATTDAVRPERAWKVTFYNGVDFAHNQAYYGKARLVRGGKSVGDSSSVPLSDCLFNWAEKNYPQYFSPAGATSRTVDVYTYRQYGSDTFLAESNRDKHLWVILAGGAPLDAGPAAQWYAKAGC